MEKEDFNTNYEKFGFYIDRAIEELQDTEGWSDSKIAFYLRDKAQSLSPRGRISKKITIDPLRISNEELKKFPERIQERVKSIKEKFKQLNSEVSIPPNPKGIGYP